MLTTPRRPVPSLVLFVGGDDGAARSCAKAASPVPVVRSKHLRVAAERVRTMKPVLVVVGPDLTRDEVEELRRVANERHAALVHSNEFTSVSSAVSFRVT